MELLLQPTVVAVMDPTVLLIRRRKMAKIYNKKKECEECYGSGYVVDVRRDNEQEIWRWSNKRPCPKCKS